MIVIEGCKGGLGIRIVGGRNITSESESDFGIFIKEIIPSSLANRDGMFVAWCMHVVRPLGSSCMLQLVDFE